MNRKQNNQRGFTLVEAMIASALMVVVFLSIFSVIIATQRTHNTENRRLDMNQAVRGIDQFLIGPCREAGAVLTMLNTTSFLGAVPQFNGILPLYSSSASLGAYPDGVMIAAGDPNAITHLHADFSSGETSVSVHSTKLNPEPATGDPYAWHAGDFGMVSRADGFYVFRVTEVGDSELTVAATAAYYSNLLSTSNYDDPTSTGTGTYPADSPVTRLDNFALFLVRSETDSSRTLVMVNDFNGANLDADLSTAPTFDDVDKRMIGPVPILPNIQDLQISYIQIDPASGVQTVIPSGPVAWDALQKKTVSAIRFEMLLRTQEETDKSGAGLSYRQPVMGDSDASGQILTGRYHYQFMTRDVGLRNYPIQF